MVPKVKIVESREQEAVLVHSFIDNVPQSQNNFSTTSTTIMGDLSIR
jgi:hypothetical protein